MPLLSGSPRSSRGRRIPLGETFQSFVEFIDALHLEPNPSDVQQHFPDHPDVSGVVLNKQNLDMHVIRNKSQHMSSGKCSYCLKV